MIDWRDRFEEPAECLNCGLKLEAYNLNCCSFDDYAGPDDYDLFDYDLFCPVCDSDEIRLHRPKEDK